MKYLKLMTAVEMTQCVCTAHLNKSQINSIRLLLEMDLPSNSLQNKGLITNRY